MASYHIISYDNNNNSLAGPPATRILVRAGGKKQAEFRTGLTQTGPKPACFLNALPYIGLFCTSACPPQAEKKDGNDLCDF